MINPSELRDLIREYGVGVNPQQYEIIYDFGIWYADKVDAGEVVLSDWTPLASPQLTT